MRKQKKEGNLFDKILKENAAEIFLPLVARKMGITIISSQPLPEKMQTTIEREVDLLRLIETSEGEQMIIHLEFQTKGDSEMIYRFSEYHGIELRKHKIKIKHFLIYLGKTKPRMRLRLEDNEIFREVELINIYEIDISEFLASQIPSEILIAILASFKGERSESMIRLIISKLKRFSKNESDLRKFIKQLTVLSRLRNLDVQTKKIVTTMPITYDITKDSFYKEGLEKGLEKVEEKLNEQQQLTIMEMYKNGLETERIAKIMKVTEKYVIQILKKMEKKK